MHQKARLLACEHDHVMFTIPRELHDRWRANVAVMATLLFASVRDTVLELLGNEAYLGAKPGSMATLPTWSQTLILHPHIHALVTGGGLTSTGQWVAVRHGFLLPSRVAMALFRGKLLAAIRRALRQGQLQLPEGRRPQPCANLLNKLGRQKWNVHIRERYPHGEGVLIYLARYLRGGPLSNQRLVSCEQGEVGCRYRVNGEGAARPRCGLLTLSIAEFIRRYVLHVPPPGSRVVRSYGLYAPTVRGALAACREQLGPGFMEAPLQLDWQTACSQQGAAHPERCPGVVNSWSAAARFHACGCHHARARDGRGMSHQQGVGPGWRRQESALTPRQSWAGNTQGRDGGLELTLSSPPHRLLDALSCGRRVLRGGCAGIKSIGRKCPTRCAGS